MIGKTLGPYQVLGLLGEGGMGSVYRARDQKLGRDVAIKVLSNPLSADPDRLRRLQREAQVLASLNHPHIATIHGLEESGGICGLVMELVEGEDLAQRLARGPMSLGDALPAARQIADALEAAHAQGIVHRDLKPANVKIRGDGGVKVLDFGIAKAISPATGDESPTITGPAAMTAPGGVVGTPAYMSPEQARGKDVDRRTDIWAFGCLLYEMLSGRRAFPGDTISDSVAAVLERQPDWTALPADTPTAVRRLLRRCLEKDPARRLHDIADARLEIDDVGTGKGDDAGRAVTAARPRSSWTYGLIGLALIAAGAAGWLLRPVPVTPEARLEITTPQTIDASVAISPDGRQIVFVGRVGRHSQLLIRPLASPIVRPLEGTDRASTPFWSPDGKNIGFFADGKLKRIAADGGPAQVLFSQAAVAIGGAWLNDGTILFAHNPAGPIFRISSQGGTPSDVTRLRTPQQRGHHFPVLLPDGRHFLFYATGNAEGRGVYVADLQGADMKRLRDIDAPAVYSPTGHLLFSRDQKLYAQRLDLDRLEVVGDAFVLDERAPASLSASPGGPIAYRAGASDSGQRQLVWFDRAGRETAKVIYPGNAAQGPSMSRDGRRIAVFRFADGNMDLWSYETSRRAWDRLTFDPGDDIYPLWSPDGTSLVFNTYRGGSQVGAMYRKILNAASAPEDLVFSGPEGARPQDWSSDGRFILFGTTSAERGTDIWALPLQGDRKPIEVVRTEFHEGLAQFSPDGKWIAYQSNKTGDDEIYVRPFPGPGGDVRVSIAGGAQVRWNPNGRELFYVADDDRLMAVPIRPSPDGTALEPGEPVALFTTNVGSTAVLKYRQQYMVAPDGQSFILNSVVGQATASPITVLLNWHPPR